MVDMSSFPIKRTDSVIKKGRKTSSGRSSVNLDNGIFPVLALNEKQDRDEKNNKKNNHLGQFLRGLKNPSENEILIEDI